MLKNLSFEIVLKTVFLLVCLLWSLTLFFNPDPWIPLDYGNFVIHEIGHLIFLIFGEFLYMLGGTILQIAVPFCLVAYFGFNKQFYSSGFCFFWLGNNVINVARYMADARALVLPIVGSGHDWNWIFSELGILDQDTAVAGFTYFIGRLIVIIGLITMALSISHVTMQIIKRKGHTN